MARWRRRWTVGAINVAGKARDGGKDDVGDSNGRRHRLSSTFRFPGSRARLQTALRANFRLLRRI